MQIHIRPITTLQGHRWQVCLDQHGVSFRSEAEARAFVDTLLNSLQAPHGLPATQRREAG